MTKRLLRAGPRLRGDSLHRARRRGELRVVRVGGSDGDTLIELLVTITVIGLTITALLGTFVVVTRSSVEHRYVSALDLVLKDFSEAAANQIELSQPPEFKPCAWLTGQATNATPMMYQWSPSSTDKVPINYLPPVGYTIIPSTPSSGAAGANSGVDYLLNNTNFGTFSPSSSCPSNQNLPQMLTVQVSGPSGSVATMSFVLTDPYDYENYGGTTSTTTTTTIPPTTTTSVGATTTTSTSTTTTTTTSTTSTTVPQTYIYISAITSTTSGKASGWDTTVTVTVEDQNNNPVGNVTVTGTWSTSVNATTSCVTATGGGSPGTCSVNDGKTKKLTAPSVTFTVISLSGNWNAAKGYVSITVPAP